MLVELGVHDLGVIDDLSLVLDPGMTALTGETGAGKTLLVEAIELLVGGRGDPVLVRPGADECRVEGRFVDGDDELVLARVVPRTGRSRAYVDGRMAPVSALAAHGERLVDLHGQHAHQSLLAPRTQRDALDRFGGVDPGPLVAARRHLAALDEELAALGGDQAARAREVDVVRHQLGEIDGAGLADPDEPAALEAEEDVLSDADAHRAAAAEAHEALSGDGGAVDAVGTAVSALAGRAPLAGAEQRLRAVAAELDDVAAELRAAEESIEADPARLDEVRARRRALAELQRKYGEGRATPSLAAVLDFAADARRRLAELEGAEGRAAILEEERERAHADVAAAADRVAAARRAAAPDLAAAVTERLRELAMPRARFDVEVSGDGPADDVRFLLAANPGEPLLPLAKVASGGELARVMLAIRLVLTAGPPVLVFDEVDAGIGGQAAVAVGRALAALGAGHQVLVVTHLPQVAAFADHQVAVEKAETKGRTLARARRLGTDERVGELSRMLSGLPGSATAHDHAAELLATAARQRGR